jgi:hypothetical protein
MAKKKSEMTPLQLITKEFNEDFNDNELQERFEQFERTVKDFKDLYNVLVPQINKQIGDVRTLSKMIVDSAKIGFLNREAVRNLQEIEASLKEQTEAADTYRGRFEKEEELMKKYRENSHSKLFHWWKTFKAIDKTTAPWLTWKRQYEHKII